MKEFRNLSGTLSLDTLDNYHLVTLDYLNFVFILYELDNSVLLLSPVRKAEHS